jgi:hypothetical protein
MNKNLARHIRMLRTDIKGLLKALEDSKQIIDTQSNLWKNVDGVLEALEDGVQDTGTTTTKEQHVRRTMSPTVAERITECLRAKPLTRDGLVNRLASTDSRKTITDALGRGVRAKRWILDKEHYKLP